MKMRRRKFIGPAGAGIGTSIAGCIGGSDGESEPEPSKNSDGGDDQPEDAASSDGTDGQSADTVPSGTVTIKQNDQDELSVKSHRAVAVYAYSGDSQKVKVVVELENISDRITDPRFKVEWLDDAGEVIDSGTQISPNSPLSGGETYEYETGRSSKPLDSIAEYSLLVHTPTT